MGPKGGKRQKRILPDLNMEEQDNQPSPVLQIATDGDVILVVGPEEAKFLCHSLFLKAVSGPFSAMFGPDWNEGHTMAGQDGPVEKALPGDNATSIHLMCAVFHHKLEQIPEIPRACDVLGIAVAADKYLCVDALKLVFANWLSPRGRKAEDLMLLATAAYILNDAKAFEEITKSLILNHEGSFFALSCEDFEKRMSWRVYCLLEEQRSFARLKLAEILTTEANLFKCGDSECGWSHGYAYAYLRLLERKNFWSTTRKSSDRRGIAYELSISKAISWVENLSEPAPEISNDCVGGRIHTVPDYKKSRRILLEGLRNNTGLCLHCIQSDKFDSSDCLIEH